MINPVIFKEMVFRSVLSIGCFFFLILILLAYVCKKFKFKIRNKIFICFIICCILSVVSEVATNLYPTIDNNVIMYTILIKTQCFFVTAWALVFFIYCWMLIFNPEDQKFIDLVKKSKLLKYGIISAIIIFIVGLFGDIPDINDLTANFIDKYIVGSVLYYVFNTVIIFIVYIVKFKELSKKDKIILIILLLEMPVFLLLQFVYPTTAFLGSCCCFQLLFIYSYYENPDVLAATELQQLSSINEKLNKEQIEFLNKLSYEMSKPVSDIKQLTNIIINDKELSNESGLNDLKRINNYGSFLAENINKVLGNNIVGLTDNYILQKYDLSHYKVLIIDDNTTSIQVLEKVLMHYNIQIETSVGAKDAINKIKGHNTYNFIIIDDHMEGLNGSDTLNVFKKLSHIYDIPPVILLTSSHDKEKALLEGFSDCLDKPIDLRLLEETVLKYTIRKG